MTVLATSEDLTVNFGICRYMLRVTIVRRLSDIVKELDLAVHTLSSYPDINSRSVHTSALNSVGRLTLVNYYPKTFVNGYT